MCECVCVLKSHQDRFTDGRVKGDGILEQGLVEKDVLDWWKVKGHVSIKEKVTKSEGHHQEDI